MKREKKNEKLSSDNGISQNTLLNYDDIMCYEYCDFTCERYSFSIHSKKYI